MTDYNPTKILGIDLGTKRVGLAIADTELKIATGFGMIEYKSRTKFMEQLGQIVKNEEIGLIVMGLPKNMDGTEGNGAIKARTLAKFIKTNLQINVEMEDERLTTAQAIKELHAGHGKVGKSRGKIDMIAAIIILQSYLDSSQSNS
jgi:putative holliday junction resolvase